MPPAVSPRAGPLRGRQGLLAHHAQALRELRRREHLAGAITALDFDVVQANAQLVGGGRLPVEQNPNTAQAGLEAVGVCRRAGAYAPTGVLVLELQWAQRALIGRGAAALDAGPRRPIRPRG